MAPTKDQTPILEVSRAPRGRTPLLLGIDYITVKLNGVQRYRTEAWQLTSGDVCVIVSENGGTSLLNAQKSIAAAVDKRWSTGEPVRIFEDWYPDVQSGRFFESSGRGGHGAVDFAALDREGFPLPR